ncbi:hypothetical protein GOODEAATRI_024613 [Goodea atripinnis]|uniref:Uncharacterized protein n=1 Tax=Goodea atripinnis TaxID=208336 RepID=A0ABV0PH11_9TELE
MHTHTHTHTDTHTLMPKENLKRPVELTVMILDYGRKSEYPERTHACTRRTCKLYADRAQAGIQNQDLLATRQQCYQLHHHASPKRHQIQNLTFSDKIKIELFALTTSIIY